jgi:DNA-binding NarL/FixJ family response regulator
MARLLIVEDHTGIRQALALLLEQEPDFEAVLQAGSLAEAGSLLGNIDLALIDLDLPDGNGATLIEELRKATPSCKILVLTASTERLEHAHAVEAGAAGIIHKSASVADIIDATRRLNSGEFLLSAPEVVELFRLADQHRAEMREAEAVFGDLTPREFEVLHALAEGLSDKEIAQKLQISNETQRAHVTKLLGKLGVHSRLEALVLAVRHGVVTIR